MNQTKFKFEPGKSLPIGHFIMGLSSRALPVTSLVGKSVALMASGEIEKREQRGV